MYVYTGTRLTTAIHRRLLSRFFLREGGRLYTGYANDSLISLKKDLLTSTKVLGACLKGNESLQDGHIYSAECF